MSTPVYKGPRQPLPSAADGIGGFLGGLFGARPTPAYKTAPTPTPTPCPPCPSTPTQKSDDATQAPPCDGDDATVYALDYGDATVIPIPASGGPVTILIPSRP